MSPISPNGTQIPRGRKHTTLPVRYFSHTGETSVARRPRRRRRQRPPAARRQRQANNKRPERCHRPAFWFWRGETTSRSEGHISFLSPAFLVDTLSLPRGRDGSHVPFPPTELLADAAPENADKPPPAASSSPPVRWPHLGKDTQTPRPSSFQVAIGWLLFPPRPPSGRLICRRRRESRRRIWKNVFMDITSSGLQDERERGDITHKKKKKAARSRPIYCT